MKQSGFEIGGQLSSKASSALLAKLNKMEGNCEYRPQVQHSQEFTFEPEVKEGVFWPENQPTQSHDAEESPFLQEILSFELPKPVKPSTNLTPMPIDTYFYDRFVLATLNLDISFSLSSGEESFSASDPRDPFNRDDDEKNSQKKKEKPDVDREDDRGCRVPGTSPDEPNPTGYGNEPQGEPDRTPSNSGERMVFLNDVEEEMAEEQLLAKL